MRARFENVSPSTYLLARLIHLSLPYYCTAANACKEEMDRFVGLPLHKDNIFMPVPYYSEGREREDRWLDTKIKPLHVGFGIAASSSLFIHATNLESFRYFQQRILCKKYNSRLTNCKIPSSLRMWTSNLEESSPDKWENPERSQCTCYVATRLLFEVCITNEAPGREGEVIRQSRLSEGIEI